MPILLFPHDSAILLLFPREGKCCYMKHDKGFKLETFVLDTFLVLCILESVLQLLNA